MAGAHDYVRYTQSEETDPLNQRINASLNGTLDELPDVFENWDAPHVRAAIEGLQRADQSHQDAAENQKTGDAFVAGHPEYIDTKANAALMQHEMNRMFGPGLHTLEQFETAYESLCASNFLKLNQAEVAKQEKAADKQRYEAERARTEAARARRFTPAQRGQSVTPEEDAVYAIPLEELRRRDAIENQKRMERIAQEGGW
jgi:hypothetical protein